MNHELIYAVLKWAVMSVAGGVAVWAPIFTIGYVVKTGALAVSDMWAA